MQRRFLEFSKDYDEINDYSKNLTTLSKNDYNKKKNAITHKIKSMPELCQSLNSLIAQLSKLEIRDPGLKKRVKDQLSMVNERFSPKQKEIYKIVNNILEKEKIVSQRLGLNEYNIDKTGLIWRIRICLIKMSQTLTNTESMTKLI